MIVAMTVILTCVVISLPFGISQDAEGKEYDFRVSREDVEVLMKEDGNARIRYHLEFRNYGGGFDIVDIGLPNRHYDLSSARSIVKVSNDGEDYHQWDASKIKRSEYIDIGVEVHVNAGSYDYIEVEFEILQEWMIYENPENTSQVSMEFRPTWFDGYYQRGDTDWLSITYVLPTTVNNLEEIYVGRDWDDSWVEGDRQHIRWNFTDKSPGEISRGACDVEVAFSKEHVDHWYKETFWSRMMDWFYLNTEVVVMLITIIITCVIIGLIFYVMMRRKRDYFRPSIAPPGAGPRHGLTAPEAAMVLELPLNKVVAMILYGMKKKGSIDVIEGNKPLFVKKDETRLTHDYEKVVYKCIKEDQKMDKKKLREAVEEMIKSVEKKMKGFSQRKTKQYYKSIIEGAWNQVKVCQKGDELEKVLKENDEWLPAVDDFDKRARVHIYPVYIPSSHHVGSTGGTSGLGGFAKSYVSGVRSLSSDVVGSTRSFTSSVVSTLHPSSSGGGGGGGCACACACACAGGGR